MAKLWLSSLSALCACVATLGFVSTADAQAIHCKGVSVSSSELQIGGVLSDTESFKGTLRVKATRKGRKPYFLPSGDLVSIGSIKHRIPPGKVQITNPSSALPFDKKKGKGRWRSIPVEVRDVRFTGEYRGGLELGSGGCKVELVLVVAGPAEISLVGTGTKVVKLELARCSFLSCGPGAFSAGVNSPSRRVNAVEVQIDNSAQSPAAITAFQVALNSEVGEDVVPSSAFSPPDHAFVRAQDATTLPAIEIDREKIDPGHYTGAIYLTVAGAEKRAVLPFELDLKDGPFWALVALIAALIVQLGVALANRMRLRRQGLSEVGSLRKKARAKLGEDAPLIEDRLDLVRSLAQAGKVAEAEVEGEKVDSDIDLVQSAQELEAKARELAGGAMPDDVAQLADELRAAVKSGSGDTAKMLDDLDRPVARMDFEAGAGPGIGDKAEAGAPARQVDRGAQKLRDLGRWTSRLIKTEFEKLARVVTWLSVYVLPWVLRGLLVAVFLFAGLKALYFSNATFGAQPVADYGGLFLWGLTAAAFNTVLGKVVPGAGQDQ